MKKLFLAAMLILAFTVNAFAIPSSFSPVVKKAAPSVVNISTTKTVTRQIDPFFQDFFWRYVWWNSSIWLWKQWSAEI